MHRHNVEEILLALVAVCMLVYLLPITNIVSVGVTLVIAGALIMLLVLRSISWHVEGWSDFDVIILIGVALSIIYLASFSVFAHSVLSGAVVLLFAVYYGIMAFFIHEDQWAVPTHAVVRKKVVKKTDHAHDPNFKKGVEPIPEHAPPHHPPRSIFHRVFRRKPVEPLPEMHPPAGVKHHDERFMKGVEPIKEFTPEDIHKFEIYDLGEEPPKKRSKKK